MKTAKDTFYFVEDVMGLLGMSRAYSYKLIRQLNDELEGKGFITVPGRVPRSYFDQRLCCAEAASNVPAPRRRS